jgi:hypothetical protein
MPKQVRHYHNAILNVALKPVRDLQFQNPVLNFGRNVARKPRLVGGVKGHNMNEISFPGSPALGGELHIHLTFEF